MDTANRSETATNYPVSGYQPSPASPRGENRQMESDPKPEHAEGPVARTIEERTATLPSDTFLWAALGAMAASCGLQVMGRQTASLFIGQWAPSFLLWGLYNKIVKVQDPIKARPKMRKERAVPEGKGQTRVGEFVKLCGATAIQQPEEELCREMRTL